MPEIVLTRLLYATMIYSTNLENKGGFFMAIYVCALCGYEYDPRVGEPENGIAEGTDFEDLPDDYVCPLCGASKEDFEKLDGED